jgi:hypothetical protein
MMMMMMMMMMMIITLTVLFFGLGSVFSFAQLVGLLGLGIIPSQGLSTYTQYNRNRINGTISMPPVAFKPRTPSCERAKRFHAFERAATVIGMYCCIWLKIWNSHSYPNHFTSRNNSASIVNMLMDPQLRNRSSTPNSDKRYSYFLQSFAGSATQPASYPVRTCVK